MSSLTLRPGRLESSYQATLFVSVAVSHLALILTGELHPAHVAVMLAALAAAVFQSERIAAVPPRYWNIALVAVIVGSLTAALQPPRDFATYFHGLTYFVIYTTTIRYFTRQKERDDVVILLLCLLEISAASIMTISVSFLFSLVLYLVSTMSALMLMTIRREYLAALPAAEDRTRRARTQELHPSFFAYSLGAAAAVFAIGFVLFFIIPRMGRSLFSWSTGIHSRVSGFSDTVEMGSVGNLLQSDALVMRVQVDPPQTPPLYLRGAGLDHYDRRRWTDTLGIRRIIYYRFDETVEFKPLTSLDDLVRQEIVLEPIDSSLLFALPGAVAVRAPFKFRGVLQYENDYFGYPLATPIYDRTAYTAWSAPPTDLARACDAPGGEELSPAMREAYLQVPEGMEELARLAQRTAAGASSPCEQAERLRNYLSANYAYDLHTPSDQAADPVSDFLFNSRRGYCQHFGSAMVLMLRSLGIPARLATGFLVDEFNAVDSYYLVRENDSHTWAEMRAPNGEWVLVDPTPAEALHSPPRRGPLKWLGDMVDSLRFRWDRWVVDLNLRDQYQIAQTLRQRGAIATRGVINFPGQLFGLLRQPLFVAPILALVLAYVFWTRMAAKNRPARERALAGLRREYRRLLRLAERKVRPRRESETLTEFAAAVGAAAPVAARAFAEATAGYQRVRFGRYPEELKAARAVERAMRVLGKE